MSSASPSEQEMEILRKQMGNGQMNKNVRFPKTLAPSFLRSMKLLSSHKISRPKWSNTGSYAGPSRCSDVSGTYAKCPSLSASSRYAPSFSNFFTFYSSHYVFHSTFATDVFPEAIGPVSPIT